MVNKGRTTVEKSLSQSLLDWYDRTARDLPWRVPPMASRAGIRPDPYRVWLSEVMLQQTTIPHATRYFLDFLERWPTVQDLAAAPTDEVMARWAGLGYYARARNLHKCARTVADLGAFPETADALQTLPGIGPYTSAAIAAIAFGQPVAAVDGNVDRVIARLQALKTDWDRAKKDIRSTTQSLVPVDRPGDFAQALMDLGATVCTPKSPNCSACPWRSHCKAANEGQPERYPIKPRKAPKPTRTGSCFILERDGHVLLHRRPPKGLLGGMVILPTTGWIDGTSCDAPPLASNPDWEDLGEVRHVFTHFALKLRVKRGAAPTSDSNGIWVQADQLHSAGLPSVFAKAAKIYTSASTRLV